MIPKFKTTNVFLLTFYFPIRRCSLDGALHLAAVVFPGAFQLCSRAILSFQRQNGHIATRGFPISRLSAVVAKPSLRRTCKCQRVQRRKKRKKFHVYLSFSETDIILTSCLLIPHNTRHPTPRWIILTSLLCRTTRYHPYPTTIPSLPPLQLLPIMLTWKVRKLLYWFWDVHPYFSNIMYSPET